ncbi:MAG: alpha/beta hydrolase [Ilumatobacteraceae bacterium]
MEKERVMVLHPQSQAVADLMAALGMTPLNELSPADARAAFKAARVPLDIPVHEVRDVDAGGVPCRLYRPSPEVDLPLVVYLHGGGWVVGDLDTHDHVCRTLANKAGMAILSVDYRLAPEHKFPAAVDDARAATVWAFENSARLGVDPARLAIAGDSAGGNLAAVVAQRGVVPLKYQVLIYPAVDMSMTLPSIETNAVGPTLTKTMMRWFIDQYLRDETDEKDVAASPILAADDVLATVPPALIVTSEFDPLCDEGEEYGKRLAKNGVNASVVRFNGTLHGFFSMLSGVDDASGAHDLVASYLRRYV